MKKLTKIKFSKLDNKIIDNLMHAIVLYSNSMTKNKYEFEFNSKYGYLASNKGYLLDDVYDFKGNFKEVEKCISDFMYLFENVFVD